MAQVTPLDIKRVFDPLAARLAPSTIGGIWGTVAHVFKTAVEADVIAVTPCRSVRRPTAHPTEKRFLSPQEVDRLAAAIAAPYRSFVLVAAYGGLRFSELAGLRVGSVDFLRRRLTVSETVAEVQGHLHETDTKTPASRRTVVLPRAVIDELSAMLADREATDRDAWLFQSPRGGPLRYSNFHRTVWAPAVRAAELDGLTMHGLRHTNAGLLISVGVHPRVIQRRLGHSKFSTTMDLYGSLLPDVEEGAADALDRMIGGLGGADVVQPPTSTSGA
jgi:integrase